MTWHERLFTFYLLWGTWIYPFTFFLFLSIILNPWVRKYFSKGKIKLLIVLIVNFILMIYDQLYGYFNAKQSKTAIAKTLISRDHIIESIKNDIIDLGILITLYLLILLLFWNDGREKKQKKENNISHS